MMFQVPLILTRVTDGVKRASERAPGQDCSRAPEKSHFARGQVPNITWCCRTTSVERFADQAPSASPLPWTVPTGVKNAFI